MLFFNKEFIHFKALQTCLYGEDCREACLLACPASPPFFFNPAPIPTVLRRCRLGRRGFGRGRGGEGGSCSRAAAGPLLTEERNSITEHPRGWGLRKRKKALSRKVLLREW